MLEATSVSKNYRGVAALSDVDMTLAAGECLGLVGPNGAGKSTLIGVLSGFIQPSSGRVSLHGKDITHVRPHVRVRRGLGRTFQIVETFPGMSCRESVMVASHVKHKRRDTAARIAEEHLTFVGLGDHIDHLVESMSLAQQRLLEFARVLALEPSVLLLDEPMSGLTLDDRARISDTVRQLHAQGVGIILVEHDMPVITDLCDRVVVLDRGALLAEGTPAEVTKNQAVRDAYLGSSVSVSAPPRQDLT